MTEKFNPNKYIMNMRGKDYLEVKWRIVWFRDEHPSGAIVTELASTDPVVMKAIISDEEGRILATGYGTPKTQGIASGRPFEGAETAAIGRALAVAGYGTQFTGEDEGEHLADSPTTKPAKVTAPPAPTSVDKTENVTVLGGDTIKAVVELGLFEAPQAAAQVLSRLFKTQKAPMGKIIELSEAYRANKEEVKETDKAIELTLAGVE